MIEKLFRLFFKPGEVCEIRALGLHGKGPWESYAKGTVSGYFNDPVKFAEAVSVIEKMDKAHGVYFTLNPVNPALLARANKRLIVPKATTTDEQVLCHRWLLIDTDPSRPSGISATNKEIEAAVKCRSEILAFLRENGFPEPIKGFSGNGGHALYRLPDLPNNQDTSDLKRRALQSLNAKFGVDGVQVDEKVFNPARICKLYGTMTRKGDPTEDRPHRRSCLENIPDPLTPITLEQLEWLADQVPQDNKVAGQAVNGNLGRFRVQEYLNHYGMEVARIKANSGQTIYGLKHCIFNPEHAGNEAAVIQWAGGKLTYQCFHNSCQGRIWAEARQIISGPDSLAPFYQGYMPNKQNKSLCKSKQSPQAIMGGKKNKPDERKPRQVSFFIKDKTLLEQIYLHGKSLFLAFNAATGETETIPCLQIEEEIIEPINGEDIELGAVRLPSGVNEYGDTLGLLAEIETHICKYLDVSSAYLKFVAYYILLSWLYDRFYTLPYLRALGDTGCGKSRFLDVIGGLCYKAICASGCVTPAPIYRLLRKWGGTLVLDEADMKNSDEYNEVVTILNCGFERGRPVIRATKDNPDRIQILPVYGPKVFATRRRFKDVALEARCLTEIMRETDREDIPPVLGRKFFEEQQELRNKLLLFRLRSYFQIEVEAGANLNLGGIEPRLRQVSEAFMSLFTDEPAALERYKVFIREHQRELIEQRAATKVGQVVEAMFELLGVTRVTMVTLVTGDSVTNITPGEIAEKISMTPQAVGQILKSLGLQTKPVKTDGKARRLIVYNQARFNRLKKRYILEEEPSVSTITNVTNVTNVTAGGHKGKPHKTNDGKDGVFDAVKPGGPPVYKEKEKERSKEKEKENAPVREREHSDVNEHLAKTVSIEKLEVVGTECSTTQNTLDTTAAEYEHEPGENDALFVSLEDEPTQETLPWS